MKAVTTMVTDSMFAPKIRNRVRLPDELIDQRRKPGEEEQYAQDASPLGKALATVGTVIGSKVEGRHGWIARGMSGQF
jgi:hypothetical protein